MATDPYAAFADPVASAPTDDPYAAFADPVAAVTVPMALKDAEAEVLRQARAGVPAADIRAFTKTLRNPEANNVEYNFGPELESVVEQIQGGYTGPVNVVDTTETSGLGATARGGLDAFTLNSGDEITAGLRSAFGDGTYEEYVQQERAQRAIDAGTNPTERMLGEALGTVASTAVPFGKVLEAPTLLGRIGRSSALGGAFGAASGVGAAGDFTEALDTLPGDVATGAAFGSAVPIAGAAGKYVLNNRNVEQRATSALENAGIDPIALRAAAQEYFKATGKGPRVADIVGPAGDRLRANLALSPETRYRAANAAEEAARGLQTGLRDQTAGRTRATQDLIDNAKARGDIEFSRFRDTPAPLPMGDNIVLGKELADNPEVLRGIPRPEREAILGRLESNSLTGGDLDRLRRSSRDVAVSQNSPTYKSLAEVIETYLTDAIPESARAVRNYARRLTRAEGTKIGQTADSAPARDFAAARNRPELTAPSSISADEQALFDTLPNKDRGALARKGGVRIGAENALDTAAGNVKSSYILATDLEKNADAAVNLRAALEPGRADRLINYAIQQKKAIDNLAGLAGVSPEQVPTVLDSAGAMINIGSAVGKGSGGAFFAGIIKGMAKALGVGENTAKKLADNLFDPAQYEKTVRLLEARKLPASKLTNIVRDSFVRLAGDIGKDNTRLPDGAVMVEQEPQ